MFSVELRAGARDDLQRLDKQTAQRILDKIKWLAEHFGELIPLPLAGHLRGLYKLRVGNYRVIYSFDTASQTITIHRIGHRKEIYRS